MDTRLQTFLTLCETMNYRQAAEKLHMTQPSVTQHIQHLEKDYGCRLFCYDKRKLTLTPQAEQLREYANLLRYQEKKLRSALRPSGGQTLQIGATRTIGEYVIPKQISRFLQEPENRIEVTISNTQTILNLLDNGNIDFGIIEGYFNKAKYGSRLYRQEPFIGFCSKDHPFAHREVALEEIFKEDLVIREHASGTRNILEQLLMKENDSIDNFNRITCTNNFGLLEDLVADNCGVTFAYEAAGIGNSSLALFFVKGWEISRAFNYVYFKDSPAEQLVELFDAYRG